MLVGVLEAKGVITGEAETAVTTFEVLVVKEDLTWLELTLLTVAVCNEEDTLLASLKLVEEERDFGILFSELGGSFRFTRGSTCPLAWTSDNPSTADAPISSAVTVSK